MFFKGLMEISKESIQKIADFVEKAAAQARKLHITLRGLSDSGAYSANSDPAA